MSRFVRKPAAVEASQVGNDLTVGGVFVPAGSWVVIREDGSFLACPDDEFRAEYDPSPVPVPDVADPEPGPEPGPVLPADEPADVPVPEAPAQ